MQPHSLLSRCVLSGDLPYSMAVAEERLITTMHFELDLRDHGWFEDGTLRLDAALRPNRLVCCVTCLYSDYSPAGHGLMGMRCHRDAKAEYLAVRRKADYWPVPVTEDVPETYLCGEYQLRIAGTGYRG